MNDNEILTERYYIYDEKRKVRRATGVFVGYFDNGKVRTGFSRCNALAGDKFDMHTGVAYAVQQSIFQNVWLKDTPANQDLWDNYVNFINRCNRYFKQKDLKVVNASSKNLRQRLVEMMNS